MTHTSFRSKRACLTKRAFLIKPVFLAGPLGLLGCCVGLVVLSLAVSGCNDSRPVKAAGVQPKPADNKPADDSVEGRLENAKSPAIQDHEIARSSDGGADSPATTAQEPSSGENPSNAENSRSTPLAAADITFDALKFDIKAGDPFERSMIPKQTEELHGKPIRIRGYIYPQTVFVETGLTQFILTRDSGTCCFGPNRALCDFIVVHMNPGKSTDYKGVIPVAVEGVFTIEELPDPVDPDGAVGAIYRLDADVVR
jgi:hypothetical protein